MNPTVLLLALAGAVSGIAFRSGGLVYAAVASPLLRRARPLTLALHGGLLVFACYAATAMLPVWWPIVPCTVLLGFAFNMLHNTLQIRATEMAPHARGIGLALFSFAWTLGQGVGVYVMGAGVGLVGYASMVAIYGAGFGLFGVWMRNTYSRA